MLPGPHSAHAQYATDMFLKHSEALSVPARYVLQARDKMTDQHNRTATRTWQTERKRTHCTDVQENMFQLQAFHQLCGRQV
jgi:hypothetical protein